MLYNERIVLTNERGFTLIELLVVILIIAILAAVAIPMFLRQREKSWEAQVQSALKNVAPAIESYGIDNGGYSGLSANPQLGARLAEHGFQIPSWATTAPGYFQVKSSAADYCVQARHNLLPESNEWSRATYQAQNGAPRKTPDVCP